ncbi:lipid II flippase MurJ [Kineosporia sp. NBRC 101677]|uniref:murein biosynthesis integral membrane protein MurJ n=1 Tax=Kineosporia sp. NBRC 101677 TaxID=3032197 RepID=UPI0024A09F07|nr:murein biosynthesis integral membrane protein MurJ [Kineosporia sp. NBRC 101677]GLY14078.1 lipid II flippase MurJ [Kineosporia sp. NBRC 101677]
MSGWRPDDAAHPPHDPDRPLRPRRADNQHEEPYEQVQPDPYAEDPYAAQREAEYVAQHDDQQSGRQGYDQPADAWWNRPPESSRRRPAPAEPYEQPYDQPYDQQQPYQAHSGEPVAPAEPTRPMRQDSPRRARRQGQQEVSPSEPTRRVRPYRPEQAPRQGQGGPVAYGQDPRTEDDRGQYERFDEYASADSRDGAGSRAPYEPYDQARDAEADPDQPYFHPLDPETPSPRTSTRRGWRATPPSTPPGRHYDLSGLDPAELTGSLNLLGLEGPALPADVTQPIQAIRAPIARAPRRPMPPVAPPPRQRERGYAEPEIEEPVEVEEETPAKAASRTSSLLGSSALMAAGTAVSRILGFVRAAVLVAAVQPNGDGAAEAFSVANIMPNALYILLAGGVLNAVLVPQIAKASKMRDGGEDYINRLLTAALGLLAVVTVVVILAAPLLVKVYSSDPDLFNLTVALSLWCLPQVFFYGLYTLLGQVLNARGSFGAFMWAPVINNVVSIAGLAVFIGMYGTGTQLVSTWDGTKIMVLAASQTLGVASQALILIPLLGRNGIRYRPRFGLRGVGLASASRVAGWTFAAVVVQQIAFVVISRVTTSAAELLKDRPDASFSTGKAIYDNAQLLFMLPHSLVAVSLVTALFTRMSNAAAENRIRDVRADLSLGLRLTGLATTVSTAAILALGPYITASMFPGNDRSDTTGIAYVVMGMALGLIPFSAQYLFQRVFYAFEDAKTPFFIQIAASSTWATGNVIALFLLRDRAPEYIVVGVGVSMAASNLVGAALSYLILRRRFGDLDSHQVFRAYAEMIVVAAIGGGVAWLLAHSTEAIIGDGWIACIIATVIGGLALLTIFVAGLRQLGVSEIEDVMGPVLRRLPSSPEKLARHAR